MAVTVWLFAWALRVGWRLAPAGWLTVLGR